MAEASMQGKITIITTGGTIASLLSGSSLSVDPAGQELRDEIDKICRRKNVAVDVKPVLQKNSEDLSPVDWQLIASAVQECIQQGVENVLVTHGTDSLAYTAAALGLFFDRSPVKICLTGSFLPMSAPNSDAPLNLLAGIKAVVSDELPTGVYVAFRESEKNRRASIFHAFDLKPMDFDLPTFEGMYGRRVATFGRNMGVALEVEALAEVKQLRQKYPTLPFKTLDNAKIESATDAVAYLAVYPGMKLKMLNTSRLSCLILSLYHSGTAPSLSNKTSDLIDFIANKDSLPVLCAAWPSKYLTDPYESTLKLIKAGALVFKDLSPHLIYTLAILGLAHGLTAQDVVKILSPWRFATKGSQRG